MIDSGFEIEKDFGKAKMGHVCKFSRKFVVTVFRE